MPPKPTRGLCVAMTTSSHVTACPLPSRRAGRRRIRRLPNPSMGPRAPRTPSPRPRDTCADGCGPDPQSARLLGPGGEPIRRTPHRSPAHPPASRRPADAPAIARVTAERRVEHPSTLEARVDVVLADDVVNLGDGGEPASHTACAWVRPNPLTRSLRRVSVTIVRCALVCPCRWRHNDHVEHDDAFAGLRQEYAAVSPVIPPP